MGSLSWSHPGDLLLQLCGRWHKVRCCFPGDFPAHFHCVMEKLLWLWRVHREQGEEEHQGGGVGEGRRDEGCVLCDLSPVTPLGDAAQPVPSVPSADLGSLCNSQERKPWRTRSSSSLLCSLGRSAWILPGCLGSSCVL